MGLALTLWLFAAVAVAQGPRESALRFENLRETVFPPLQRNPVHSAFDVLATDYDLDGDPDILINWHHHHSLELLRNDPDGFVRVSPREVDATGLLDNPGIRSLYADADQLIPLIQERSEPGLYLWHDPNRRDQFWRFYWLDPGLQFGGLQLTLETSIGYEELIGLRDDEIHRPNPRRLEISLRDSVPFRRFKVRTTRAAIQLIAQLEARNQVAPRIFVGPDLVDVGQRADLWKADPHGIAWVDVHGSAHPEIYISRGTEMGLIQDPAPRKTNRFFLATPDGPLAYSFADPPLMRPDAGRGRGVEWVDANHDGLLDLWVANEATPSLLLSRGRRQRPYRDLSGELGLDLPGGAATAWGDYDGDGYQDLFALGDGQVVLYHNRQGRSFRRLDGASTGLRFNPQSRRDDVFEWASLRLTDSNSDGHLDVWVIGQGAQQINLLFRWTPRGYRDVSEETGVLFGPRTRAMVFLDADLDGYEDMISFGLTASVWHNRFGLQYDVTPLLRLTSPDEVTCATTLDADGDGRTDVVAVGRLRHLLVNQTEALGGWLDVELIHPHGSAIGALVRAFYADGRVIAKRVGSEHRTAFSQTVQPLRFARPADVELTEIRVQWPNSALERTVRWDRTARHVVLEP